MKSVKWLYALFFALTFTLAVEMTGAFAVQSGAEWYRTLTLPSFAVSGACHSVLWCIVYALEAFVISQLLVGNNFKPFIAEYLCIKFLSAVWTVCFFGWNRPFLCLAIITVILAFNFIYQKNLLKLRAHPLKSLVFFPVLLWYCYLWIMNYCIVLMN